MTTGISLKNLPKLVAIRVTDHRGRTKMAFRSWLGSVWWTPSHPDHPSECFCRNADLTDAEMKFVCPNRCAPWNPFNQSPYFTVKMAEVEDAEGEIHCEYCGAVCDVVDWINLSVSQEEELNQVLAKGVGDDSV